MVTQSIIETYFENSIFYFILDLNYLDMISSLHYLRF